jgi:2-(3-amino-3-carboxypropyl)histidine synthase
MAASSETSIIPRAVPEARAAPPQPPASHFPPAPGIPPDILQDAALAAAITALPANYSFEVHKCVWKVRAAGARRVGLQLPEGLLLYACALGDIIARFTGAEAVVLGDVTYGACCVDDLGAAALGCDFLIHYGHSCLVPIDAMGGGLRVLYVFVAIAFDVAHLCATVRAHFGSGERLALAGTIQFAGALAEARGALAEAYPSLAIPQAKPLSPGEVLGCTAPALLQGGSGSGGAPPPTALIFVADGRFHLEAMMIRNPGLPAYRYDPYSKVMTRESYDHAAMQGARRSAVARAAASLLPQAQGGGSSSSSSSSALPAKPWGLVLGTLGRQGSPAVLDRLSAALSAAGCAHFTVLLAELSAEKLGAFGRGAVGAWVQVACPRLSIDWGEAVEASVGAPLLTPYEAFVALGAAEWGEVYPMDYYQRGSGPWTNYHVPPRALAGAVEGGGARK